MILGVVAVVRFDPWKVTVGKDQFDQGTPSTHLGVGQPCFQFYMCMVGLSTSPSTDHLYSNLWVWSTCRVITWIRMGLGTGSPGPWMITYRLPVCICACPNLHDGPMLLPGSDAPTSSTIPEDVDGIWVWHGDKMQHGASEGHGTNEGHGASEGRGCK